MPERTAELVRRVGDQRDEQAFRSLFETFVPKLLGYFRRHGCARDMAEDLVQEVMSTVWRTSTAYDEQKAQVSTWIFAIARNRMIDRIRHGKRPTPDPADPTWQPANLHTPEHVLDAAQTHHRLRQALATLPSEQRETLDAAFINGLSLSQIAEKLDLPLGTVKSRVRLAMQKLREALAIHKADADA